MIARYTPKDFAALWSAETRYAVWLDVELCACEALEAFGLVPKGVAARIRSQQVSLDVARIEEIEATVKHDVIAFLTHVEERVGPDARFLHRGMTSSDVLDTSLAVLLVRASDLLLARIDRYIAALAKRADEHRATVMMGRSHGMHAEPVTFGVVLAGHLAEAKRGRTRLVTAKAEVSVGKIAGAVGTYAHLSPELEKEALSKLGLSAETVSTQVVSRDRHAAFFATLGVIAAGVERLATNVRHWQRTEVNEAEEKFTAGQKGSSAMPHKRNPIVSENLCGLARVVRAAVTPALEDVALWHERDISHSSVERIIAPDVTTTLGYMLGRAAQMVEGLVVNEVGMQKNFGITGELCFSEGVLLALVDKGRPRQEAYVLVQRAAMAALSGKGTFQANLRADAEVTALLSSEEIACCFDVQHAVRHANAIVDRALSLP